MAVREGQMSRTQAAVRERKKAKRSYYDYTLLFLTLLLIVFGFVMIYSSSSYIAQLKENDAAHYLKRQMMAAAVGFAAMFFVSVFDYRNYLARLKVIKNLAVLAYIISIFLQIIVLIPGIGIYKNGARRWLPVPGFGQFQPSDFAKIAIILFAAYIVQKKPDELNKVVGFVRVIIYILPLLGLIAVENLSTAIVAGAITLGICYVASKKNWYFILMGILVIGAGAAYLTMGGGFRAERVEAWRDVENHPKGFQTLQGLYAIASGGIWGTGLGESMQKLGFIPEAQNDMIFSIICEELGLVGAIAVLMMFVLLLWRIFMIGINSVDLFGGLICTGVFVHIAVQVLINIAVVTNSIPNTGIALPFISYGGTSIVLLMAEIGLALSVSRQIGT